MNNLKDITTKELIIEIKNRGYLDMVLLSLMLEKKIDFIDISNAYTTALNSINDDKLNQLIEAEACVFESFLNKKDMKKGYKHTQRCLYLLNESNRFNITNLNEKFNYDADKAKEFSYYYTFNDKNK